jgi:hypothetical protein
MWHAHTESLNQGRIQRFDVLCDEAPVTYREVLSLWRSDAEFRSFFTALLSESPFRAFRWETPPVASSNVDREFQFVLLQANALDRTVDATAFSSYFTNDNVVTFPNLRGDAVMVVPCPLADESIYGHLASFVRHAPPTQVDQLWQSVGAALQERLGDAPVWLNTAGMGVAWLHVRLDSRPKYYGYAPFKQVI